MDPLFAELEALMPAEVYGRVVSVQGLLLEIAGPIHEMSVGALGQRWLAAAADVPLHEVRTGQGGAAAATYHTLYGLHSPVSFCICCHELITR